MTTGTDETGDACPADGAHRRLEEAHRLWHRALDGYQDEVEFRTYLNACLQALRNSTFHLQAAKASIDGFEDWYAGWQDSMRADPVMKWANESRIAVVHSSDLETESTLVVSLHTGYFDVARALIDELTSPALTRSFAPKTTVDEAIASAVSPEVPSRLREQGTLVLERRWVVADLPGVEILSALSHVYGFVSRMLEDLHGRLGRRHVLLVQHEGQLAEVRPGAEQEGRLPCMVMTRERRCLLVALGDGRFDVGGQSFPVVPNADDAAKALRRYKTPFVRLDVYPMSPIDLLPRIEAQARAILKSGEEHGWFALLYRGARQVHAEGLMARDAADKRALAERLARIVSDNDIDGILIISEAWVGPLRPDEDGVPIPPGELEERTEALAIIVETQSRVSKNLHIPFRRRRFGRPVIGETYTDDQPTNFLAPVRAVWELRNAALSMTEGLADSEPTESAPDQ